MTVNEDWDLVIRPSSGWLDLHLKDIWRYRDLLRMFVWRDFVAVYKQTILGPIWFFIQPLLTTATFTIIFSGVAKLSTDGLPPLLFYLAGTSREAHARSRSILAHRASKCCRSRVAIRHL